MQTRTKFEAVLNRLQQIAEAGINRTKLPKEFKSLSLDEISSICCSILKVKRSILIGKVNHNKVEDIDRKIIFLTAAYFYSNESNAEISKYLGCYEKTLRKAPEWFKYAALNRDEISLTRCKCLITILESKCPGRLEKLEEVTNIKEPELEICSTCAYKNECPFEKFKNFEKKSLCAHYRNLAEAKKEELIEKQKSSIQDPANLPALPIITTDYTYTEIEKIAFDIKTDDKEAKRAQKALIKARNRYQKYDLLLFKVPVLPNKGPIKIVNCGSKKRH